MFRKKIEKRENLHRDESLKCYSIENMKKYNEIR